MSNGKGVVFINYQTQLGHENSFGVGEVAIDLKRKDALCPYLDLGSILYADPKEPTFNYAQHRERDIGILRTRRLSKTQALYLAEVFGQFLLRRFKKGIPSDAEIKKEKDKQMSYEGYEEYICPDGHHWIVDASIMLYGEQSEKIQATMCPECKKMAFYHCSVDETNGIEEDNPYTLPGPKEEIGFEDKPMTDHRGNKYFLKIDKYRPILASGRWKLTKE